jgi:outer membrane immunogenic protein
MLPKYTVVGFVLLCSYTSAAAEERWSGAYAGLIIAHADGTMTSGTGFSAESPGQTVGAALGHNWSWDGVLVGLEGDFSWSNIGYSDSTAAATVISLSTARVRVGLPFDGVLPYATAGLALAAGRLEVDFPMAEDHQIHIGLAAGGGVEFALTEATSVKLEYLYVELPPVPYWQGITNTAITYNLGAVRAGLNVGF